MIRLYLVRHGIAVDKEPGAAGDDARGLTAKGRHRFRRLARAFARLREPAIAHVFTSPLVRAVQTAEILLAALKQDELSVLQALRPETGVASLLADLGGRVKDGHSVAIVGHDPLLSMLAAFLGEVPREQVDFRKGAIVCIDVPSLPQARPAKPLWWLRPKTRTQVPGLPLKAKK